jgi:hypothetical protein
MLSIHDLEAREPRENAFRNHSERYILCASLLVENFGLCDKTWKRIMEDELRCIHVNSGFADLSLLLLTAREYPCI